MSLSLIIIGLFILNFIIIFKFEYLIKKINIYDFPNELRKKHEYRTPLFGGILIFVNLLIISFSFLTDAKLIVFPEDYFESIRSFYILIIICSSFFIMGLYDDKYNLNSYTRLSVSAILIYILINIDNSLLIKELTFTFYDKNIFLETFSHSFTILSFVLFINAMNMYDGINLQSGLYYIFIYTFVSFHTSASIFLILFLIPIIFFIYLNYKNKSFLGDSGVYLLSFILGYVIVKTYNIENNFAADEIFLIMMLPGIELLRLSISRIFKGINPFAGDRNHLHHYLTDNMNIYLANLILALLVIIPLILMNIYNSFVAILIFFIVYISMILNYRRKS